MRTVSKIFVQLYLISLPARVSLKDETQDSRSMHTYHTRNGCCVGSDIRIGGFSVSTPIQGLTVVLNAEGGTDSTLWLLRGNSHWLFL